MQTTIIRGYEDGPYHSAPTHVAYSCPRVDIWWCVGCDQAQPPATWRFFAHRPGPASCGPDSPCFTGPLCPHCAEEIGIATDDHTDDER